MDKAATLRFLQNAGIDFEITEHQAVYNMEELDAVDLPYPDWDAKNLFVCDEKKRDYYLITVKGDKRVNLNEFRKAHGLKRLRFASEESLRELLGLIPGAVTPLGLLNDKQHCVRFFLDGEFSGHKIGVHPNDNTATVWLQADDLVRLLEANGTDVEVVEIQ